MPVSHAASGEEEAMRWIWLIVGVLAVVVGIIWTLQGVGILGGSVMTGKIIFAVIGPIISIVGLVLVAIGIRQSRAPTA
jgi:hypothetical protein